MVRRASPAEQTELFPAMVSEYQQGRDELNLAEFPIAAIGNRVAGSEKTLRFEDKTFDKATNQLVHRKVTITASDEFGLPNSLDDEVILGLVQMTRLQNFDSPRVTFTISHLLRVLGWDGSTYNRRRIQESINRWIGVSLYYENAWREKATGEWVDRSFNFISSARFYKPGQAASDAPGQCVITWNPEVFASFKQGNLKTLDFHAFRRLKSGTAKRLFRFLDKRFHHRSQLTFELVAFACDKIGLTRPKKVNPKTGTETLDIGQLKTKLNSGIKELEAEKFIETLPVSKRYTKDFRGLWQVHFTRYNDRAESILDLPVEEISVMEGRLISHGMTRSDARLLVSEYDDERIARQLEILDFLLVEATKLEGGRDAKIGPQEAVIDRVKWLESAIREDRPAPARFVSGVELTHRAEVRALRDTAKTDQKQRDDAVRNQKFSPEELTLEKALQEHGVSVGQALKLVVEYGSEAVALQLEVMEHLITKDPAQVKNRGGWLHRAISEKWVPPAGFKTKAQMEQDQREQLELQRKRKEAAALKAQTQAAKEAAQKAKDDEDMRQVEAYLTSLTPAETESLEVDALKDQPEAFTREGSMFRKGLIQGYVLRKLASMKTD